MDDKIIIERKAYCKALGKEVYQQLTYAQIRTLGKLISDKKLVGTFCFGYPKCGQEDCQLVIGSKGYPYSGEIDD